MKFLAIIAIGFGRLPVGLTALISGVYGNVDHHKFQKGIKCTEQI